MREKHARNYVNMQTLYTRVEDKQFEAEDVVLFFDDQSVQGVPTGS